MEYRELGRTGLRASRLGFGSMRLPTITIGSTDYIDFDRAVEVLHAAFRLGINYVDCGFLYVSEQAEIAVGRAVNSWHSPDDIIITDKATKFRLERQGDLRRMLEHQLQRLDRDWVHFYLFHGIGWDNFWELDAQTGWIRDMFRAQEEGLVRHVGFSFHDEPQAMIDLVNLGWAELVTCQYNYLDRRNEAAMRYAASKGVAVVVMGPVGGGRLAVLPKGVAERTGWSAQSAAELALRFVASNPDVDVMLSGMNSVEMVEQNVMAVEKGPLAPAQVQEIAALMDYYGRLAKLYCTGCQYCLPCPQNVNIPRVFELFNYLTVYGLEKYARREYARLMGKGQDASHCIECETCLERCPQSLPIPERLKEAHAALSAGA